MTETPRDIATRLVTAALDETLPGDVFDVEGVTRGRINVSVTPMPNGEMRVKADVTAYADLLATTVALVVDVARVAGDHGCDLSPQELVAEVARMHWLEHGEAE